MNDKQIKKWEATRVKGKIRFVVVNGIVYWGIFTAVLWSYIMAMISGKSFISYFYAAIVIFPLGGIFFGFFSWNIAEKKYLEAKNKKNIEQNQL